MEPNNQHLIPEAHTIGRERLVMGPYGKSLPHCKLNK